MSNKIKIPEEKKEIYDQIERDRIIIIDEIKRAIGPFNEELFSVLIAGLAISKGNDERGKWDKSRKNPTIATPPTYEERLEDAILEIQSTLKKNTD